MIGLNITDGWPAPMLAGETADGSSNWTDSMGNMGGGGPNPQLGATTLEGSAVVVTWHSANTWAAGQESNSGQQLYRVYLDDGDGGSSLVAGDGIGVSVTVSGLAAWLLSTGDSAYRIRFYSSTDTDNATFRPVDVRLGAPNPGDGANQLLNLTLLESVPVIVRGPGDYPDNTLPDPTWGMWQSRGYGDTAGTFSADTVSFTIPSRNGSERGTLAGFKIESVPEPSGLFLLGIGSLLSGWRRARRA